MSFGIIILITLAVLFSVIIFLIAGHVSFQSNCEPLSHDLGWRDVCRDIVFDQTIQTLFISLIFILVPVLCVMFYLYITHVS